MAESRHAVKVCLDRHDEALLGAMARGCGMDPVDLAAALLSGALQRVADAVDDEVEGGHDQQN